MTTKKIKTTKLQIKEYWKSFIDEGYTSVTYKQADTHCWRCGVKKRFDRCHIIPSSHGGADTPCNFILLCKHCHFDNPNLEDASIIWDWIKAYRLENGETFWMKQGEREYEYIYSCSIDEKLTELGFTDRVIFCEVFEETMKLAGHHFGQPRNNRATVAGVIALSLKKMEAMKWDHE